MSRMEVWVFLRSLGVIYDRWVIGEGHKNYFKDGCLLNLLPQILWFYIFIDLMKWLFY